MLKSDNGSAFISQLLYALLAHWQVVPLFSPPRTPEYNGSCEAGIGAMKVRTRFLAARAGRFLHWTSDDFEAARLAANEFHRPWGHKGLTPSEVWAARQPITAEERAAFAATLARCQERVRHSFAAACGNPPVAETSASPPPPPAYGNLTSPDAPAHAAHGNPISLTDPATIRGTAVPPDAADAPASAHGNAPLETLPPANTPDRGPAHGNASSVDAALPAWQAKDNTTTSAHRPSKQRSILHGSSQEAIIHRRAVRQALRELGLLSITRRSISLPIRKLKSAKIM